MPRNKPRQKLTPKEEAKRKIHIRTRWTVTTLLKKTRNYLKQFFTPASRYSFLSLSKWLLLKAFFPKFLRKILLTLHNTLSSSWKTSKPEYPMFILFFLIGCTLGTLYYYLIGLGEGGHDPRAITGLLTVIAAPLVLLMWKWRNTHKLSEFNILHRNANEALLVKAGEQLGSDKEVVRHSGIEAIDRYARLMMENADKPDYPEFQRAVNLLCSFARQRSAENRAAEKIETIKTPDNAYGTYREITETSKEPTTHKTDYLLCIDKIFILMRDYYPKLMDCCKIEKDVWGTPNRSVSSELLSLPLIDLNHCDLSGITFKEAKYFMVDANLSHTNMSSADLSFSECTHINLTKADLTGAFLIVTNLQQANLQQAKLQQAFLFKANLQLADLQEANLQLADLRLAKLQLADLQLANLLKANLQQADLKQADLKQAYLKQADLLQANLFKANLQQAYLQQAKLQKAKLLWAKLQEADLQQADLQEADLQKADLQQAYLKQANLQQADLQEADLQEADLQQANLRYATLDRETIITSEQIKTADNIEGLSSIL